MLIQQQFSWPTTNWPASTPATQYTVFQAYPGSLTALQNVTTTSATLTFDETVNAVYQVRPSSGDLSALVVGPEVTTYVIGYVPCRAWIRQKVRMALADRADGNTNTTLAWPDDELNQWITEAFGELNVTFPVERTTRIQLAGPTIDPTSGNSIGTRNYALPDDFYQATSVMYSTMDQHLQKYLTEKPWKGGESTALSYMGYPKLGIWINPIAGRFYPGHYYIYQNQLWIDWDAFGNGDYLQINYDGRRPLPTGDADLFEETTLEDMELISLYTQMKAWLRLEGNDTRLSRWIETSKRDGMPTVKQSFMIKQLYDQRVNDRREMRPRSLRLIRR